MTNTIIQFKRSEATAAPTTLSFAEPAYSFSANKLYIGNTTGHVHTVGGRYYTELIDNATDSNVFSTIMKRDAAGIVSATAYKGALYGNANTATKVANDFWINLTGDITASKASGNGSANIDLTVELSDTGVTAAWYGSSAFIPVYQVDVDGRIVAAANVAVSAGSTFNVDGDSGSGVVAAGETLEFIGGDGITTSVADVTPGTNVTIDVDSTVVRTTGEQTIAGYKIFSGNVTMSGADVIVTGNLTISGTTTYANTTHLDIGDNILTLNADLPVGATPSENAGIAINRGNQPDVELRWNETSDFFELTEDGTNYKRIFHDAYANASSFTTGTMPSARLSGSYTGITGLGTVTVGTWSADTIAVNKGGTNITSYAVGDLIFASGTTTLDKLADVPTGNVLISGGVTTAPLWGKVGLTTHVSGTLAVDNGGTGNTTFITNGVVYGRGTSGLIATAAGTEGKVLQASATGVPVFGDVDGGTF